MKTLFAAALTLLAAPAFAQGGTANRPAREPAGQTSLPNSAALPPSTTQATGATHQDPVVKQMNEAEKAKVEKEGK
jgi:hypothetical protein